MFKTTSELLTAENWELIMEVCDRVGTDSEKARQCFEVINERMLHRNPNVVLYTMTLVHSMVENCGQSVKQEVASRAFTTTLTRVLNDKAVHEKVKSRILGSIQQWAFDFRQDPTLSLMEETYTKLRAQRFHFPSPQKPEKIPKPSDLERQKEEDDLQLALALSLSSVSGAPGGDGKSANYQTPAAIRSEITRKQTVAAASGSGSGSVTRRTTRAAGGAGTAASADLSKRKVQVKALFDFTPTEAGELGFFKGDVIDVLDQKYRDWWKGELRGKSGIFPANFVQPLSDIRTEVSKDIDAEVQVFSEAHNIEALLRMLGSIDPMKGNVSDNEEIQRLYGSTLALRPKIIKLIEKYNRKKEELVQLDSQFSKSMRLYDELMQRSVNQTANYQAGFPPQQQQSQPQPQQPQQPRPQQQPQQLPQQQQQQIHMQQPGQAQPFVNYSGANMAYSQPVIAPQQLPGAGMVPHSQAFVNSQVPRPPILQQQQPQQPQQMYYPQQPQQPQQQYPSQVFQQQQPSPQPQQQQQQQQPQQQALRQQQQYQPSPGGQLQG
ncbi:ESCRT-0 subunit protein hse1 [Coemansia guatemalensis]|uniref:Class E vacuolar protein-sorting machinery protein HSE1 n=1 Tax=Coemansia guatemalensis TaxID=2761395 RepID=A0A9W8HRW3_9FUNG|nr:ESCRT-0 subunit protein hse1 [Coemansia guatemalensis]